jgi:hypothetical protein
VLHRLLWLRRNLSSRRVVIPLPTFEEGVVTRGVATRAGLPATAPHWLVHGPFDHLHICRPGLPPSQKEPQRQVRPIGIRLRRTTAAAMYRRAAVEGPVPYAPKTCCSGTATAPGRGSQ